jgi:general secretion pathway protein E
MRHSKPDPYHTMKPPDTELTRILFKGAASGSQPANRLLEIAVGARATDVHIDPLENGFQIRLRVDGCLDTLGTIDRTSGLLLENQLKTMAQIDPGIQFLPRGSRFTAPLKHGNTEVRLTLAPCISGPKLALRLLDPDQISLPLNKIGMGVDQMADLEQWLISMGGLFLVSGPTGSGKTTTLYALLHELIVRDRHVLTIEDPVEYEIEGINQIQIDKAHGLDFATGVRSMLRLDPDDLMVGETRDSETAASAVRAAISGHSVLTTIHARDVVSGVTALRNFGCSNHDIAVASAVFVNQRLIRLLCADCRDKATPDKEQVAWFEGLGLEAPKETYKPGGCTSCKNKGYKGRTGVFEIWRPDSDSYEMLLAGKDERALRRHLAEKNHQGLLNKSLDLVKQGITSPSEMMSIGSGMRADDWVKP